MEGEITDDRSLSYVKLQTPPSKSAKIEYTITFRSDYVELHFYTTEHHINLEKNCSFPPIGQVSNTELNKYFSALVNDECRKVNNILTCTRFEEIQDFIPRSYSFSFGFKCEDVSTKYLKGLTCSKYNSF